MESTQKLTKKQKKALAFRTNTKRSAAASTSSTSTSKSKSKNKHDDLAEMEARAVPIMEEQDDLGGDGDTAQVAGDEGETRGEEGRDGQRGQKGVLGAGKGGKGKGGGKEGTFSVVDPLVKDASGVGKKRKREEGVGEEEEAKAKTKTKAKGKGKRKAEDGEGDESGAEEEDGDGDADEGSRKRRKVAKSDSKQRYILFVGNLKYTTPKEAIQAHFAKCDPPPTVRLLTPKNPTSNTQKAKSKGCAFLEFSHRNALQQALKLHQSSLDGRMINVELTAGGGGKSDSRLAKVKERNKALSVQRTEKVAKNGGGELETLPSKPQRYSATSGVEQVPTTARTWSVADGGETVKKRGKKGKGKPANAKSWGTGVNSIPVG